MSQTVADTTGGDASRTQKFTYNGNDLEATATDPNGNVTGYTYNAYGDLATETDPASDVTDYAYDAEGQLLTVTLQNYTGNPAQPTSPAPLVTESRAYDPAGRLASVTDSMGWATSYGYTDDGLTASVTRSNPSSGATTTNFTVDADSRTAAQTLDPAGLDRTTSYAYTADSYLASQTLTGAGSNTPVRAVSYGYDPMGNMTSMTDLDNNVTYYSYDQAGRLSATTDPTVTTQVYGGSPTSTTPVTLTGYDTFGEPAESSDANGNATVTAYDADGNPVSVTNQTSYTYDQLGDVATQTDPDGGVSTYSYDTNGDQLSVTGRTGAVSQATYDYLGRMVTPPSRSATRPPRRTPPATPTTIPAAGCRPRPPPTG
jgi:YD repeat-containing protein